MAGAFPADAFRATCGECDVQQYNGENRRLALPREVLWCDDFPLEIKGFSHSQPRFWESTRCIVLQDVSEAIPKIIQRELRVRCADA